MNLAELREALKDGRSWVHTGVVESITSHRVHGYLASVQLPDERVVECELAFFGAGAGRGIYMGPEPGDEVLVLLPNANQNRAIALAGLNALPAPTPEDWDISDVLVLHPGGARVQKHEGADVEAVLKAEAFQGDLNAFVGAVVTALDALAGAMNTSVPGFTVTAPWVAARLGVSASALKTKASAAAYSSTALKAE